MSQHEIPIDANGNAPTTPLHVSHGDKVYWKADDPSQTWYISFDSPFVDHAVFTDPSHSGKSIVLKVRKRLGYYSYTVSDSSDPTLSSKTSRKKLRITTSGGGIIIDN